MQAFSAVDHRANTSMQFWRNRLVMASNGVLNFRIENVSRQSSQNVQKDTYVMDDEF